jgi:hypothetical protein
MEKQMTSAIGATVTIAWDDEPTAVFEEYISYGEYNPDEENDGFGVHDSFIFYYVKDYEELEALRQSENGRGWVIKEIIEESHG